MNQEKSEGESGQGALRERIKGLEDSLAQTVRERDEIRNEAEKVKSQKESYDEQYDDLKRETLRVRNDYETGAQQVNRLQLQIESLEKA